MTTDSEEIRYSSMTRVAGQTEEYALDVLPECGQNRAGVSAVERGSQFVSGKVSVAQTPIILKGGSNNLANRRAIAIRNLGPNTIYVGKDSSVSVAVGFPVTLGETLRMKLSESQSVYAISESGTQDVRVLEIA